MPFTFWLATFWFWWHNKCDYNKIWMKYNIEYHHHHHHLFWKSPFLPRYAKVRRLPIWSPSTHPWIPPIQDVNQALPCHHPHVLSKSSFSSPYISPLPPPFYRPIPNHSHFYALDAQTTSICHLILNSVIVGKKAKRGFVVFQSVAE